MSAVAWTRSISLDHLSSSSIRILCCLFISVPLFSSFTHLNPFIFPVLYLQIIFLTLSNLYSLLYLSFSSISLHHTPPVLCLSPSTDSVLSSFQLRHSSCTLVSFLICNSITCFSSFLFPFHSVLFLRLHSSCLHLPFLSPLPSLCTVGQTRVDKVEKKPYLTSEGISIYNQSVCVAADQQQPIA